MVRRFECLAHFDPDLQSFFQRHGSLPESLGQRLALQIFHDQEIGAILVADIMQGADPRMVQG